MDHWCSVLGLEADGAIDRTEGRAGLSERG